jgi:hypothetical protein
VRGAIGAARLRPPARPPTHVNRPCTLALHVTTTARAV